MIKSKTKPVFITNSSMITKKIFNYIVNDLGINNATYGYTSGKDIISVPTDKYEEVLSKGKEFASRAHLGIGWIDHYNRIFGPIDSCNIGYGILQKFPLEGENYNNSRRSWELDEKYVPEIITEYLKQLKEYLNIDKIFIKCLPNNSDDFNNTDILIISIPGLDYETQSKLFKKFVKEYGTGPFIEIHPSTFTGEYVEEPIISKNVTK